MESALPAEVQRIIHWLEEKQGFDILLLDLRGITDTTDYFILCSGNSDQHVRALADEVMEKSKENGDPPWHVEGYTTRRWVLLDFVHVVVHIFRTEAREFYALERLWGDAPQRRFGERRGEPAPDASASASDPQDTVFARF